jgi:hypothetical protein
VVTIRKRDSKYKWETQNFPESLTELFLKIHSNLKLQSPSEHCPCDWMQLSQLCPHCRKHCRKSSTQMLSTAASDSRLTSATAAKHLNFGYKTKWWFCLQTSHSPDLASCVFIFFPRDESEFGSEAFCWRSRPSTTIAGGH